MHSYARTTVRLAKAEDRVAYLQKVMAWTFGGLFFAGLAGIGMAFVISAVPFLSAGYMPLIVILACFGVANYVAPKMVFGESKLAGFLIGNIAQGTAMGYLLLTAFIMGGMTGSPFGLIGTALAMTALTAGGILAYVMSGPKDFSMLGGILSAMGIPMLVLMALSFFAPGLFGGPLGMILCGLFVVISAAMLLWEMNRVVYELRTDQHIEGSYMLSISILVLFWNILSLILSAQRD